MTRDTLEMLAGFAGYGLFLFFIVYVLLISVPLIRDFRD